MEEYFFTLAASLIIGQSLVQVSDSSLVLLGGVSQIDIDSLDQSEVLDSFEIFGCSDHLYFQVPFLLRNLS